MADPANWEWADILLAYRGVCTAGFPNYWFLTGPNTGVGTTSQVFMIEQATESILKCLDLGDEGRLIGVSQSAQSAYNEEIQTALGETVWSGGGCQSWYMWDGGRIATLCLYNARTWKRAMRRVHREAFGESDS